MGAAARNIFSYPKVHTYIQNIFAEDMHAKRVESLANATVGVMTSASLAIHIIGQGLAESKGLSTKHSIKQVDRLLSNSNINLATAFSCWVPHILKSYGATIKVIIDWTDFDKSGHTTLMLSLATSTGRSIPLMWKSIEKDELKGQQKEIEKQMLIGLKSVLPPEYKVTVLADRGFADQNLYDLMGQLDFNFVFRFRQNTYLTLQDGEECQTVELIKVGGRAKVLREVGVSRSEYLAETVVLVWDKGMKEPWCLVSNIKDAKPRELINDYAKRWGTEALFRDNKDIRFGFGMSAIKIKDVVRRDKLFLLGAIAMMLLSMLGAAGEAVGLDRHLKANTSKKRTLSLIRQGTMWYGLLPNMPKDRMKLLINQFKKMLNDTMFFRDFFCYV